MGIYIDESAKVIESKYGNDTKLYRNTELRNSILGDMVSIGDDTILINCDLESNIAINRRNFIQESKIGRFTYTGFNSVIRGVQIGRFCSISWNTSIGGKNHDVDCVTNSAIWGFYNMYGEKMKNFSYGSDKGYCELGNDVLVSSNAVILRNVRVGHGAVIGAGAVVTKDVDPYTIVAGVPAKPIRKRFSKQVINSFLELKWWDWPIETIKDNVDLIYQTKVDDHVLEKLTEIGNSSKK